MEQNIDDSEKLRRHIAELEQSLNKEREKTKSIKASQKLLTALSHVQSQFILDVEPRTLFDRMLSDLLSLTQSEYGFIGKVLWDESGDPYLKTDAITNIAWNEELMQFYEKNAPKGMIFSNLKTLFGAVLTSGQPVISNSPASDPRSGGLPEGHPALNSFLGLSICHGGKLVGMVGIANRPGGYDKELVTFLEPFITTCATMIESLRTDHLRRSAEESLRSSEAKLKAVFDGIMEPLIMVDNNMKIIMLNQVALKYYETNTIECSGKTCFGVLKKTSEACKGCRLNKALSTGEPMGYERKGFINPNLSEWVSIYPLYKEGTVSKGAIIRISDITQKKEVERQLMRAGRLSSLGQLSGGIAHEIRNPLSGINLFVDILSDEEKFDRSDQELEILQEIKTNIRKISAIITRILALAKRSHGSTTDVNVNNLIEETIKLWFTNIRDTQIHLDLSLAQDLDPVFGDSIGLQQVLNNIIQNGIEAMGEGGTLKVRTSNGVSSFYENRKVVRVEIEDHGQGIPADDRERIFDPFFTTKSSGNGLGLSISHQIIESHGGIINCESEPGEGTTFTIEVPFAPEN